MRVMVIVKASKESEAGEMPSQELLAQMGKYNEQLVKAGFFRVWINGEVRDLNDLDTKTFTSFELVITRLRIDAERRTQITEAIEQAFELSKGNVNVLEENEGVWLSHRFTSHFACNKCGTEFVEPTRAAVRFSELLDR